MNKFLMLLSSFLLLVSCDNSEKEIKAKIDGLYANHTDFNNVNLDLNLFSDNIVAEYQKIRKMTEIDVERIKNSDSPTDKPFVIEGTIFTSSIADGYTKYTIQDVKVIGNKAVVSIQFESDLNNQKINWIDKVELEHQNDWKITNIIFSKSSSKSLLEWISIVEKNSGVTLPNRK